jgi:hypothetical protein
MAMSMLTNLSPATLDKADFVGLWLFDEGAGKTIKDFSSHRNNGTFEGNPKWGKGKFGLALELNGKDEFVQVPHSNSLDITEQLTIIAWVNTRTIGEYKTFVTKGDAKGEILNYGVQFIDNAQWRFFRHDGTGYAFKDSVTLAAPNQWMHVGVTYDLAEKKVNFYIDGKLDASHDFPELTSSQKPLLIGKHIHSTLGDSQFWDGFLDELAILNVALTETEINEAMGGLKQIAAVDAKGKLTTTWAAIKGEY